MKILEGIKKFFVAVIGAAFFIFALAMTILLLYRNDFGITVLGSRSLIIVDEEIANENYKEGDLIIVKSLKLDKIQSGDEIFAYGIDENKNAYVTVGTVGDVYVDEKAISFSNGAGFSSEYIIGKAESTHEKIGTLLNIFQSRWGFLFLILIPSFLVFIYEIYSLIVEIKYGD